MYNFNQHLHFVGIGGVGMAGIAEVLLNLGYPISGSDLKGSPLTAHLESLGAVVRLGHRAENVPPNTAVVVISSAVSADNAEVVEATSRNIPVIPRAEMLAELMRMKYGIAVAGSHGKTTTTSMTAKILRDGGLDPTVIIGGRVLTQTSGALVGTGQYLVAEADESDGSFCLLSPAIALVTNIDSEHLSHYGSFGALEDAFARFMGKVPFYGLVVACFDDPVVARLAKGTKRRVVSFGLSPEHDFSATDITVDGPVSTFTLRIAGKEVLRTSLPMPGSHMVSNALGAIAIGVELGLYPEEACASLERFPGVARRSELIAKHDGVVILDDYAHHPREIAATLSALKRGWVPYAATLAGRNEPGRLIAVFQPHRYSRTRELFSEFLTSFTDADTVYVSDIYSAGEEAIPGVSGESLARAMSNPKPHYVKDPLDAVPLIRADLRPGDVVVTVGAGNVYQAGRELAKALER